MIRIFSNFSNHSKVLVRNYRYLRPEYRGEYLPKVDRKVLENQENNPFSKYSNISKKVNEKFEQEPSIDLKKWECKYPEFYPDILLPEYRNKTRERLERQEMMKRRSQIEIPEFYVGSYLAVTAADRYSSSKTNRFVGICIFKRNSGINSIFRLRNVVNNMGIEIEYELYNPTLLKIELLKLEKRLDDNLLYLRDAPLSYSKVPFDMVPVPHNEKEPVPINKIKVPLIPGKWGAKWLNFDYRGIDDKALKDIIQMKRKSVHSVPKTRTIFERYDLMKIYYERGSLEDRKECMRDVEILHKELTQFKNKG